MCGIVGLYLKKDSLRDRLGEMFAPMLVCMSDRGPDSAGFAIYGDPANKDFIKVTLRHDDASHDWKKLAAGLAARFGGEIVPVVNSNYAVFTVRAGESALRQAIAEIDPSPRIMSIGTSIEILKEIGLPQSLVDRFGVRKMKGTHIIGHTRMATESAVTTDGSHPFSTGMDLCLVHNGSLSNHNRLREQLKKQGLEFRTENDSEVAAGYLTWQLKQGKSLREALQAALVDLDGFYTFAIGTAEGFAVLRDPIACKPAVLAETEDYVAMASEYQSLAHLPGIEHATIWEPKPAMVYTWGNNWFMPATVETPIVTYDLATGGLRALNQRLHDLSERDAQMPWRITNPRGGHAIAAGVKAPVKIDIDGHVGYYCAGMNQRAQITIHGMAGTGVAENMMLGVVRVKGQASQCAGATGHGGLLVIEGDTSSRCGISMKGIDIVVHGSVGHMSCFMAQAGTLVVCGDADEALGDSIYEARIFVRGKIKSLGADCIETAMEEQDRQDLAKLLESGQVKNARPEQFRRYGSARKLYNFHVDHVSMY